MFLLSGCFQLPCVQSTVSKAPPPPIPPRPKHKRAKRLTSIEETKTPGSADGSGPEANDLVCTPSVEEKEEKDVLPCADNEGPETDVVQDSNNNPAVQNSTLPECKELGTGPGGHSPNPLLLTPGTCAAAAQKSVSTGSVNLEGLEVKVSLGKTLSDQGSEGKPEQGLDKSLLKRSLSDPDLKNRDHKHPLRSSVLSRIRKMSSQKNYKQEKSELKEVSSEESGTTEPQGKATGVEVAEEASALDEAEVQAQLQPATAHAVQEDTKTPEVSGHAPHSKNFFRRVSVKLKHSFTGKSKMECEEDAEMKMHRERAKNMKEKKVEVIDLREDSVRKPSVRKMSVVEMCSTRRAGRYRLLAVHILTKVILHHVHPTILVPWSLCVCLASVLLALVTHLSCLAFELCPS